MSFKARVTLIGVVPPLWDAALGGVPVFTGVDEEAMQRNLELRLDEMLTKEFMPAVPVERIALFGRSRVENRRVRA